MIRKWREERIETTDLWERLNLPILNGEKRVGLSADGGVSAIICLESEIWMRWVAERIRGRQEEDDGWWWNINISEKTLKLTVDNRNQFSKQITNLDNVLYMEWFWYSENLPLCLPTKKFNRIGNFFLSIHYILIKDYLTNGEKKTVRYNDHILRIEK